MHHYLTVKVQGTMNTNWWVTLDKVIEDISGGRGARDGVGFPFGDHSNRHIKTILS